MKENINIKTFIFILVVLTMSFSIIFYLLLDKINILAETINLLQHKILELENHEVLLNNFLEQKNNITVVEHKKNILKLIIYGALALSIGLGLGYTSYCILSGSNAAIIPIKNLVTEKIYKILTILKIDITASAETPKICRELPFSHIDNVKLYAENATGSEPFSVYFTLEDDQTKPFFDFINEIMALHHMTLTDLHHIMLNNELLSGLSSM
jgi:hypothetical protein